MTTPNTDSTDISSSDGSIFIKNEDLSPEEFIREWDKAFEATLDGLPLSNSLDPLKAHLSAMFPPSSSAENDSSSVQDRSKATIKQIQKALIRYRMSKEYDRLSILALQEGGDVSASSLFHHTGQFVMSQAMDSYKTYLSQALAGISRAQSSCKDSAPDQAAACQGTMRLLGKFKDSVTAEKIYFGYSLGTQGTVRHETVDRTIDILETEFNGALSDERLPEPSFCRSVMEKEKEKLLLLRSFLSDTDDCLKSAYQKSMGGASA